MIVAHRRIYLDVVIVADTPQKIKDYETYFIEFISKRAVAKNRLRHHNIAMVRVEGGGVSNREA